MKSSPENPFLFIIGEDVPALKNNKRFTDTGVYTAPKVKVWYQRQQHELPRQLPQYDIPAPKTLMYVRFEMLCKNAMTRYDLDNAYTTLQEALQPMSQKEEGILGLVSDDKYVQGFSAVRIQHTVPTAFLWCWEYVDGVDDIAQLGVFRLHRDDNLRKRYKKQTSTLAEFDF